MGLHPSAANFAAVISAELARAGPTSLQDIYGLCKATDGGAQYFVREAIKHLVAGREVRSLGQGRYESLAPPSAVERPLPRAAAETAPTEAETPEDPTDDQDEPGDGDHAAAEDDMPTREPQEESEMPTQTATAPKPRARNGHADKTPKPGANKTEWTIAFVKAKGTARFADIFAEAKKQGVYDDATHLGATLSTAVRNKRLKKVERGVYAAPGAKVVYDAKAPKRTAEDVKRVAAERKTTAKPPRKAAAPVKPKAPEPAPKPAAKPGRKPSAFRGVYDEIDGKIAAARADEKSAAASIADIDGQLKRLAAERKEHVAKRDAARTKGKSLAAARKRVADVESGVAESLKT